MPKTAYITDVGPRDGLQNESKLIPAQVKVELINKLKQAGLKNIECGSFVSAKWVPQMANSGEVFDILHSMPKNLSSNDNNPTYIGLVMNRRGIERANDKNVKEVLYVLSASEEFSKRNMNCSVDEAYNRMANMVEYSIENDIIFRAVISTSMGCPYEGHIHPSKVCDIMSKMAMDYTANEINNVIIADTIGVATAGSTYRLLNQIISDNDSFGFEIGVHFHDTYGQALANILTSLSMGVNIIESSVGGLGGCPFAKGATGNVATEEIVYMLNGMDIETGIDLEKLMNASNFITEQLGKDRNASSVTRALNAKKASDKE
eukprot:CAMPEP_0201568858 /NCGR_PEP_ID=MMETSP0190_2-20130828/10161_1 /ASSEMBLY_ACC=CAM_ASM_000263 /TAXON_ID=37353 /ORGANISM="Rosalina sp." /LENGTH=318 /DNA_ID=CAMNT_0047990477 /DNA_START=236 /DNA_END=1192 /DNA_ORIENTATION=+